MVGFNCVRSFVLCLAYQFRDYYVTVRLAMRCYIVAGAVGVWEDRGTRGCGGVTYDIKSKIRIRGNIVWTWIK